MKTLLLLTLLNPAPELPATTTKWFDTAPECEAAHREAQAKTNYVNGACVELVKPYKAGLEAPNG